MTESASEARLLNHNLVELSFLRQNITLDVSEVREGWEKALHLSPGKRALVLLKTASHTLLEKEAREYVMKELQTWPGVAIVIDGLGQRLMGQFVINMTGNRNKIKLFECRHKALEWLRHKLPTVGGE